MSSTTETRPDVVERLERAATRRQEAERAVAEYGADAARRAADAHASFVALLERYEDDATGTGDFRAYVEFQEEVAQLVEGLPDDLPERDAFEAAEECLDQRRLTERDFDAARDALSPAADAVDRLDERETARERFREARRDVERERREVAERVDDLERLLALGGVDLDAPTERLRDPIETYNEAVREAFDDYRAEASARDLLDLAAETRWFPLVEFREPPADLREFVESHEAGTEPVEQLLSYADYSRSKLDHYVDDPDALKRAVATRQTYLERLDAEPLTVGWPPPAAGALERRTRECEAVLHRFAGEDVVAKLRAVRRLPVETDYERLREAAVAAAELDDAEREMLANGEVEAELAEERERLAALDDALEAHED